MPRPINLIEQTVFDEVRQPKVPATTFDLSHNRVLTGDMGILYPVLCQEVVPGDYWEHDTQCVVRFQPLVAPILHEVNVYVHYFFVPYRLLDTNFTAWLVGPKPGDPTPADPPRWTPAPGDIAVGSLWDHLGFPVGVVPTGAFPLDFPRRAYNLIWNEYYRDINVQTEVSLTNSSLLRRNWEKDYFTASLPWQQRGVPPALPLTGLLNLPVTGLTDVQLIRGGAPGSFLVSKNAQSGLITYFQPANNTTSHIVDQGSSQSGDANLLARTSSLNASVQLDLSTAGGQFTLPDLRTLIVVQQWMERNARGGTRYVEYLRAHFGIAPLDQTLQRPEYLGGYKAPVLIQDVEQTSETGSTPQGTLAGKGISVNVNRSFAVRIEEYGLIIGLLSVMPKAYYSQGISRQWLRESRYDFYNPLFALLSEQPVKVAEIYATGNATENNDIFGFQGRFDELRYIPSTFTGKMRTVFDYWHLGRKFASRPYLNSSFLQCVPDKRIFAVPSEDGLIISVGHRIEAKRPLPRLAEPGLQTI